MATGLKSNNGDGTSRTPKILQDVIKVLNEENVFDPPENQPVVQFLHPKELQEVLKVNLEEDATTDEQLESVLRQIVRYSVRTSHPNFHNQLYGGVDEYGLAGAWLTEALNTSQYTFEVGPVFTLIERVVLQKALALVGYQSGDGILSPGGSIANMYGMVLARHQKLPEVKRRGLSGFPPLACFASEAAHYSIMKGAHWLGLGTESVFQVKTDDLGRLDPEDLRRAIKEAKSKGHQPFFVNATAGTTVLGAFDPLTEISLICKEDDLWLHVDACWGGTLLLSDKYRGRLKGLELSDSVSWNPHKMLGAPLQCSLFLVKDEKGEVTEGRGGGGGEGMLGKTNSAAAKYLFQQDKFYDVSWDTGDKSVQCGRKVDAFKLWLMWKARGTSGLKYSVDAAMDASAYFLDRIRNRVGYRLVLPEYECSNICFWYIPPSMRGQKETKEWWEKLYTVAPKIKELMILDGSLMLGYTPLSHKNIGNFFRMVVTCRPIATKASMDFVIQQVEKFGAHL